MKKLILSIAIVGITSLTAFAGNGDGGCKGKGCTCTGNCKADKCTMKCCSAGDKKACTKDGKCAKSCDAKSTDTKATDSKATQK